MTRMARDESRYGRGHDDATIAWPLLVRAVMERVDS